LEKTKFLIGLDTFKYFVLKFLNKELPNKNSWFQNQSFLVKNVQKIGIFIW
jgi:hypothetical protein